VENLMSTKIIRPSSFMTVCWTRYIFQYRQYTDSKTKQATIMIFSVIIMIIMIIIIVIIIITIKANKVILKQFKLTLTHTITLHNTIKLYKRT